MTTFLITYEDGSTDTVHRPELYVMIRSFLRDIRRFSGEALDKTALMAMSMAETSQFTAVSLAPRKLYWNARLFSKKP